MKRLNWLYAHTKTASFLAYEIARSHAPGHRRLRILFSRKSDWEGMIAQGFRFTPHTIVFGELQAANLAEYDLVVPLTLPDIKYLNTMQHLIPHNPLPIPSIESLELCDDKILFIRKLIDNGYASVLPRTGGNLPFPYVLKKRIDDFGRNTFIISDALTETAHSDCLSDPEYYTQQFIPGPTEYATHVLCRNGQIIASLNIEYTFQKSAPIKGKDKVHFIQLCPCPYLDTFTKVLQLIGFEGLCCFNYKVCEGRLYILEINPRFGSSLSRFFFAFTRRLA